MQSIKELLAELASPGVKAMQLARLSDLAAGEVPQFREGWPGLPVERRRQVVKELVELAEDNVELNFHWVLRVCLEDADPQIRVWAIEGLWECQESSLMQTLVELLYQDSSPKVRARAATGLGQFAMLAELNQLAPRYADLLLGSLVKAIQDGGQPVEVRCQALEAVSCFSRDPVPALIALAYHSSETDMKLSAVYAMGHNLDPRWLRLILQEMVSSEAEMRYEAVRASGELGEEAAVPYLIERLKDDDLEVQLAAIRALGKIGGGEAKKALEALRHHPQPVVRQAVEDALTEAMFAQDAFTYIP